ncbi:hypothetical protein AVEN_158911-1 [Araneus ventricosus]|uniref:Uncharacterized protein n=1 Tax=Araneus ventricosus TaxID=182803 RepID=A0A4Y2B8R5_ARAVE|nr:hypothetical protein AVEN_158911-1 [Araneus ventricosus]
MMKPEPAAGPGRPQQTPSDDIPWWLKYGVRFLGSVAALAALALGAMACLTITPRCLLAGIVQIQLSLLPTLSQKLLEAVLELYSGRRTEKYSLFSSQLK